MSEVVDSNAGLRFAKKLKALLTLAGFNPREVKRLSDIRTIALDVFVGAFEVIYRDGTANRIIELMSGEAAPLVVAQTLLETLGSKTGNQRLSGITAQDIIQGNDRAIGVLINILYAESEKIPLSLGEEPWDEEEPAERTVKGSSLESESFFDDDFTTSVEEWQTRRLRHKETKSTKKASPVRLTTRIAGEPKPPLSVRTTNISTSTPTSPYRPSAPAPTSVATDHPNQSPAKRNRDLRPALTKAGICASTVPGCFVPIITTESVFINGSAQEEDSVHHLEGSSTDLFTYDLTTGRKMFGSSLDASISIVSKQLPHNFASNKRVAVPWIKPPPTTPEWPGDRLAETSQTWVQRVREIRSVQAATASGRKESNYDAVPKFYTAYNRLEPLDLVISVEHCFNCKHHSMTLRHDPREYVKYADAALLFLARKLHACCVSARVGVVRLRAEVSPTSKTTDKDSRIGALEVQMAYRNNHGQICSEVIYSKLKARKWPSQAALEKRAENFVEKAGVSTYYNTFRMKIKAERLQRKVVKEGLGSYPVGVVPWDKTPLAMEVVWHFPIEGEVEESSSEDEDDGPAGGEQSGKKAAVGAKANSTGKAASVAARAHSANTNTTPSKAAAVAAAVAATVAAPTISRTNNQSTLPQISSAAAVPKREVPKKPPKLTDILAVELFGSISEKETDSQKRKKEEEEAKKKKDTEDLNVQWVFDNRREFGRPKYLMDTIVLVSGLSTPLGGIERYPLMGTVKGFEESDDSRTRYLTVELKYCNDGETTAIPPAQCDSFEEIKPPKYIDSDHVHMLPCELEALFAYLEDSSAGFTGWVVIEEEDYIDTDISDQDIHLSMRSFFHQCRKIAAEVEAHAVTKLKAEGAAAGLVRHPFMPDVEVDLQRCYCEEALEWIQRKCGQQADIMAMRLMSQQAADEVARNADSVAEAAAREKAKKFEYDSDYEGLEEKQFTAASLLASLFGGGASSGAGGTTGASRYNRKPSELLLDALYSPSISPRSPRSNVFGNAASTVKGGGIFEAAAPLVPDPDPLQSQPSIKLGLEALLDDEQQRPPPPASTTSEVATTSEHEENTPPNDLIRDVENLALDTVDEYQEVTVALTTSLQEEQLDGLPVEAEEEAEETCLPPTDTVVVLGPPAGEVGVSAEEPPSEIGGTDTYDTSPAPAPAPAPVPAVSVAAATASENIPSNKAAVIRAGPAQKGLRQGTNRTSSSGSASPASSLRQQGTNRASALPSSRRGIARGSSAAPYDSTATAPAVTVNRKAIVPIAVTEEGR